MQRFASRPRSYGLGCIERVETNKSLDASRHQTGGCMSDPIRSVASLTSRTKLFTYAWKSTARLSLAAHVFAVAACCGVIAVGSGDLQTDSSLFLVPRGTGSACVSTLADGVGGSGGGSPCTVIVGFIPFTGLGTTGNKLGLGGSGSYSDMATAMGTTASGSASWAYEPGFSFFGTLDKAFYSAQTSIDPTPPTVRARARARADDPLFYDAAAAGTLGIGFELTSLDLEATASGSTAQFAADYKLDGTTLFQLQILAPGNFGSVSDLILQYESILGPSVDAGIRSALLSSISVDPTLGTVFLSGPVTVFPTTEFSIPAGTHELDGGVASGVDADPIPEPFTVYLTVIGAACILGYARLNGRSQRTLEKKAPRY